MWGKTIVSASAMAVVRDFKENDDSPVWACSISLKRKRHKELESSAFDSRVSLCYDTHFSLVVFFAETLGNRGRIRTRRRLCTCEHTLLWYFVFSHPTERDRGSFTPAESVTRHEACLSLCSIHLGEQTSQSHSQLQLCTFFFFCNIHFICMPDCPIYIPLWFIVSRAPSCIFDKGWGDAAAAAAAAAGAAKLRTPQLCLLYKNNLACAASLSNPSAILSPKAYAFLAFWFLYMHIFQLGSCLLQSALKEKPVKGHAVYKAKAHAEPLYC